MTKAFVLSITLGNDAMQTSEDVGGALLTVAQSLGYDNRPLDFDGPTKIYDANGNAVGSWSVQGANDARARD